MTRITFETAVVGKSNGNLSIALMARLPKPFPQQTICVAILECSVAGADGLCRELGSALQAAAAQEVAPAELGLPIPLSAIEIPDVPGT